MSPLQQFRDAIQAAGLTPPDVIEDDGKLRRFSSNGKRGDDSGWYCLHGDGIPAGSFGDWRSGLIQNWRADIGRTLSPAEEGAHRARVEAMRQAREAEETRRKAESREKAGAIWKASPAAPVDHPYLARKQIKPYGVRLSGDALVIPVRADGDIHSLQFIGEDGGKRFLPGGRVRGCYFSIGNPTGAARLVICEGFATGASIHEATGYPVAVAFNAGNLLGVAQAMRAKFPDLPLIVCGDDDYRTEGNTGKTKAIEAAQAVGGKLAFPDFGTDRPDGATDFNDMAVLMGLDSVARSIGIAMESDYTPQVVVPTNDDSRIGRLAELSPIEYDRVREAEAKALGVRSITLDKEVKARKQKKNETEGIDFDDVTPWPHSVVAGALLSDLSATVQRFIICPEETAHAAALWVSMSWFMDVVQVAPLAVITAPEKRCGKSQLLFLLGRLVHRPLAASNITPAALFRAVDAWKPTLLVDEADAFMKDNEELRGLLNCGHTRDSAYIVRVVGDDHTPKRFNVWGAKALAGIGHLADTIMDRAIVLELRRKLPHEEVQRLRHAEPGLFDDLAAKLARFAIDNREALRQVRPDLPAALNDRAQDNWEPLLAIAELAGGEWPSLARHAALKLSGSGEDGGTVGNELLADIRELFETKQLLKISTADLIQHLCDDDEKSWATYNRGKPISPRQVATRLKEYGIASKTIRLGHETAKGFELEQFKEAFARYLALSSGTSVTASQPSNHVGFAVTDHPSRYPSKTLSVTPKPALILDCDAVTDRSGESQGNHVEVEV
ncbi:hypothetical protein AZSI13_18620 [Azospira sp. I13]|uniref:DUF3631 domain-containing protein n=1 Tax=Azospira sp. I13 TaxID=1765050 RepID=UPI000D418F3E|nr:DUF3631 domain-containing protein [Azospira sp. I13]GBG02535.1 hypothetical protein AZSI13_18620 [Azospira sp. I13]